MKALSGTRASRSGSVVTYVRSPAYEGDLAATVAVWSGPHTLEAAGSFVLLTYFATPCLLAVQSSADGRSVRLAIDGHRERTFLELVLGLTEAGGAAGGISNAAVRATMTALHQRHRAFAGMTGEYMEFIGGLLAIAPLRLPGPLLNSTVLDQYWRYMTHAMRLLDIEFGEPAAVEHTCRAFAAAHSGRCAIGDALIQHYRTRHAIHVSRALPALFSPTRTVLGMVSGGTYD